MHTCTLLSDRKYVPDLDKIYAAHLCFILLAVFLSKLCDMSQSHLNSRMKGLKLYKNNFKDLSYCLSFEMLRFYLVLDMILQESFPQY